MYSIRVLVVAQLCHAMLVAQVLAMNPVRQMAAPLDVPPEVAGHALAVVAAAIAAPAPSISSEAVEAAKPVSAVATAIAVAATPVSVVTPPPPKTAPVKPLQLPASRAAVVEKPAQGAQVPPPVSVSPPPAPVSMTQAQFLDRLMMAESSGRDTLANLRSTALGAYQFIVATWLDVMKRHFAAATAGMTIPQILALRTDRTWSRHAAEAYTNDNAAHLAAHALPVTYPNLRLAFLLGPQGATRILKSEPNAPVISVLGPAVVQANPFMSGTTAASLIARSARDVGAGGSKAELLPPGESPNVAGVASEYDPRPVARGKPRRPVVDVRCKLDLPSCRRWFALAERRALRTLGIAAQDARPASGRRQTLTR